jgi:hypothetical protein
VDGPHGIDLSPLGLKKASPRGTLIQIKIQQMPACRFPPWSVEELDACFVAKATEGATESWSYRLCCRELRTVNGRAEKQCV